VRASRHNSVIVQARLGLGFTNLFADGSGYDMKTRDLSLVASYAFAQ